ncbi:2-oxo acid dehydrogenase subunit E2 [Cellulomonas sp. H30R-01]|uniref:dihydrolipoamide acetyltransferase family protein n=1 Tax=Cellulomonas sp. H30R-01 TaxID=2704467 RepID=UPI00138B7603|nr:dihydrolipoamide acetyltransferase family protein [Cellulomonas sp. H30R-01]QHT55176.1 2-oxo acid dehydrogenase subunit E2 [Cellulomonas sp. H30R-01]
MSADRTVRTVTLPDLGEGLTESDLVEWLVAVGDTVTLNQVVAEVETAKALVQLPSPWAGVVEALLVEPGTTVAVGGPLLTIAVPDTAATGDRSPSATPADAAPDVAPAPEAHVPETAADVVPAGSTAPLAPAAAARVGAPATESAEVAEPAAQAVPERTSVLVGYGPLVEASARPHRRPRSAAWLAAHASTNGHGHDRTHAHPPDAVVAGEPGGTVAAPPRPTPPVRKLAHDLGVHLERVQGTGPSGQITRDDVLHALVPTGTTPPRGTPSAPAAAPGGARASSPVPAVARSSSAAAPARPATPSPQEVRVPVTGVRKQTAAAMVASAFTAPHASVFLTVDVTPTTGLLADLRADRAMDGHRVTLLALVAKAVTLAVRDHPDLNARWDEPAGEIVRHAHVGLGIAAATPRGLLVPVVHDADTLRLPDLADALRVLTESARAGTTTPADLSGGTLTLTNVGVFGVDGGTPILVPGQSAIVAVGAVRRQPWEHEGAVALRDVLTLTVSFDHRVVDGEQASRFLADVGRVLARPASVLAMV